VFPKLNTEYGYQNKTLAPAVTEVGDSRVNHRPGGQSSETLGRSLDDVSNGIEHTDDDVGFRTSETSRATPSQHSVSDVIDRVEDGEELELTHQQAWP